MKSGARKIVEWSVVFLVAALFIYFAKHLHSTLPPKEHQPGGEEIISNALVTASPQATAAIETPFSSVNVPRETPQAILPSAAPSPALPGAGPAHQAEITNVEPQAVLENMRTAIHNFGQRLGGNPVGNNAEITRALLGENPKQVNFISADAGLRVDTNGELIDAWGTPFFFHQLSASEMEIRSAGPDKIFFTLDDLITR